MQSYVVADGDYWRLLTAAFLHGSLLHIAFNMYALYLFGPFVEKALGTVRFIAAYLTTAIASSVFVYWLERPELPTIGASGAVFGLFGMALLLLLRAKQDVTTLLVLLAINARHQPAGQHQLAGSPGRIRRRMHPRRGVRVRTPRSQAGRAGRGVCRGLGGDDRRDRHPYGSAQLTPV